MNKVYIYGLFDPQTNKLRYIGKANNPTERLQEHISSSRGRKGRGYNYNPEKEKWIRQLLSKNLKPIVVILEECTEDNWQEIEKGWIKQAKERGENLTNITSGGDGFGAGENHPLFGKKLTEEHKRKCILSLTGQKRSNETKEKLRLARIGKKLSPEWRKSISDNHANMKGKNNPFFGKKHSEETKQKISLANTGKIRTLEQRKKLGKWAIGKKYVAKLEKEQVLNIREEWNNHTSKWGLLSSLSIKFGVCKNTIWLIVHNKTWIDI